MFLNLASDRCAVETGCQTCPSRSACLPPTHRIGRPPLKEGVQAHTRKLQKIMVRPDRWSMNPQ